MRQFKRVFEKSKVIPQSIYFSDENFPLGRFFIKKTCSNPKPSSVKRYFNFRPKEAKNRLKLFIEIGSRRLC